MEFNANPSLTKQISDFLEEKIVLGKIKPGERIQEIRYANELSVSRNSVREALIMLERRHLIIITPRKGALVKKLEIKDLSELLDTLAHVYVMLVQKAAFRWRANELESFSQAAIKLSEIIRDKDSESFLSEAMAFPGHLFSLVENAYLRETIENLQPACARLFFQLLRVKDQEMELFLAFVQAMVEAMRKRDKRNIEFIIKRYARRLKWQLLRSLKGEANS